MNLKLKMKILPVNLHWEKSVSTSLLHLSVRKEITDAAVNTIVVSNSITIHPRVTQVVTQVTTCKTWGTEWPKLPLPSLNIPACASLTALLRRGCSRWHEADFLLPCSLYHQLTGNVLQCFLCYFLPDKMLTMAHAHSTDRLADLSEEQTKHFSKEFHTIEP